MVSKYIIGLRYSYVSNNVCPFGDIYNMVLASEQLSLEMAGKSWMADLFDLGMHIDTKYCCSLA